MKERFERIAERWFLMEPAFFRVYCSHVLRENARMNCGLRCGAGRIEYNPQLLENVDDDTLAELLSVEAIRILLKHPYERQPEGCGNVARTAASDCVISDAYSFRKIALKGPCDWQLDMGEHFEFYAYRIEEKMKEEPSAGNAGNPESMSMEDQSGLWEEDALECEQINSMIRDIQAGGSWGSMPADLIEDVVASTRARIDYRKVLSGFRSSIIASSRKLTRMRPNRRSGFMAMGSERGFTTSLLVAVDVSGSITAAMLSDFYGIINRFFRYGIDRIDAVQFDVRLGEVEQLDKARQSVTVKGRGGTSFQPVIDYVSSGGCRYDGLIILTDGYAEHPVIPPFLSTRIVWVCPDSASYETGKSWMEESGRVCIIELKR